MADLALRRRRCLDPLRRLTADAAHHVGMGKSLRRTLLRLDVQRRWDRLRDSRVEGRGAARDDEVVVALIARAGPAIAIASARAVEGRVSVQRGTHCDQSSGARPLRVASSMSTCAAPFVTDDPAV